MKKRLLVGPISKKHIDHKLEEFNLFVEELPDSIKLIGDKWEWNPDKFSYQFMDFDKIEDEIEEYLDCKMEYGDDVNLNPEDISSLTVFLYYYEIIYIFNNKNGICLEI